MKPHYRRERMLWPDEQELVERMSRELGRPFDPDNLDRLRGAFLTDEQKAYLKLIRYRANLYPYRKHGPEGL